MDRLSDRDSPEDGQAEGPQHQRASQVQLRSLSHEVLTAEHERGVQAAEHERLAPADTKHTMHSVTLLDGTEQTYLRI